MNDHCLVVLGGGIKDVRQLSQSTINRLDTALEIQTDQEYILVVGAGPAQSPPPLDEHGFPVFESVGAIRYLMERGIHSDRLLYETSSYDTIGNAYFSRYIHVQQMPVRHLTIITSAFHLPRTQLIFDWVYGLLPAQPIELDYIGVDDGHLGPELLKLHQQKELDRINHLKALQTGLQTAAQFHDWMFNHHQAYIAHQVPIEIVDNQAEKRLLEEG